MVWRGGLVIGVAAVSLGACSSKKPAASKHNTQPAAVDCTNVWSEISAAPESARWEQLFSRLTANCLPCGGTLAAPTATLAAQAADVAVKACGGACSGTARDRFIASFDDGGVNISGDRDSSERSRNDATRPWRQLATDCPDTMGTSVDTKRFASQTWYWLQQLARATPPASPAIELPLPAWSSSGNGFALATVAESVADAPRRHISVTQSDLFAGALPWGKLGPGPSLTVIAGGDYPGPALPVDELGAALNALPVGPSSSATVALIAPRGLPISRVLEVLAALGEKSSFAVRLAVDDSEKLPYGIPSVLSPALRSATSNPSAVVTMVGINSFVILTNIDTAPCSVTGAALAPWWQAQLAKPNAPSALTLAVSPLQPMAELVETLTALNRAFVGKGPDAVALLAHAPLATVPQCQP